jgi:hypothetical protein
MVFLQKRLGRKSEIRIKKLDPFRDIHRFFYDFEGYSIYNDFYATSNIPTCPPLDSRIMSNKCYAPYCRRKAEYKIRHRSEEYFHEGYCEVHAWMTHLEYDFDMVVPWNNKRYDNLY